MSERDWSNWLDEHGPALVLLARQYTPSPADAEDVVQEAFARFWAGRHQARDAVAYLYTCVRHCALDWLRGARRRDQREQAVARSERAPLFESRLEQDEERRRLEQALGQLPAEQREVLVLKVWAGLSFPAIAAVLGIPANTAASRYRYALERLRRELSAGDEPAGNRAREVVS